MKPKDALSMIERCHRQLEKRMAVLVEAAAALAAGRGGAAERDAAVEVLDFLDRSDARHVADEEESIFPRLAASGREEIAAVMAELERQHRAHDQLRRDLRAELERWSESSLRPARLAELADQLDRAYREHIALEDEKLTLAIPIVLDPGELAQVFAEMQARRGKRG